ncbi:MAG: hypothetical protein RMK29_20845 [Myxococcales bacterium]|nr:hypothetical protein [Myxococcota bacterium]MDW8284161.1 hypothetical protein [Myxococcales bacterium]
MQRDLTLAGVALALLLLPQPAAALKTGIYYRVTVDGSSSGSWYVRNRVQDTGLACRYTLLWGSLCILDEIKAWPEADCESMRRRFVNTAVIKPDGQPCRGQDGSGQRGSVVMLQGGETSSGRIFGVVQFAAAGDVQSLVVRPR